MMDLIRGSLHILLTSLILASCVYSQTTENLKTTENVSNISSETTVHLTTHGRLQHADPTTSTDIANEDMTTRNNERSTTPLDIAGIMKAIMSNNESLFKNLVGNRSHLPADVFNSIVNSKYFGINIFGVKGYYIDPVEFGIVTGIYSLTFLLGVIGNSLVIYVIVKQLGVEDVTNIFLFSLSLADLLVIVLCVPLRNVAHFSYGWYLGGAMCKILFYANQVSFSCSIMTLTMMAIERYVAICHPLKSRYLCTPSISKKICCVVWFGAFVLGIPALFAYKYMFRSKDNYTCDFDFQGVWKKLYWLYWLVIFFVIPLVILFFSYGAISVTLWRSVIDNKAANEAQNGSKSGMPRENDLMKKRLNVINMLIVVVVIFFICWGPLLIMDVIDAFGGADLSRREGHKARVALRLLSYFNSCVNPVIYCFMSRKFRDGFKKVCMCCGRRKTARKSTMHTSASPHVYSNSAMMASDTNATELTAANYTHRNHSGNQEKANSSEKTRF
ncbi:unnamed protein product [Owenia fusiformis]|uniref:G-protein coupled receptors family 1 profile domain-containing protein n=1 Tax=Owenia fusiformis TaxID=6347 RepID=A0A8S4N279_OWEFU|nr:unnamed protein product [Owenia fusiformis]